MPQARLKRITAGLVPAIALTCALPVATAGANQRHSRDWRGCEMHEVVVNGEIATPAASGASSFSARIKSVQVHNLRLTDGSKMFGSRDGKDAVCPSSDTGTTTSGTSTAAGTSSSPVAVNTDSTTKIMLNGAASTVGSLPHGDHFVAVFLVPASAGNASNSGIPAPFVAAWPSHESAAAVTRVTDSDLHLFGDILRHETEHQTFKK